MLTLKGVKFLLARVVPVDRRSLIKPFHLWHLSRFSQVIVGDLSRKFNFRMQRFNPIISDESLMRASSCIFAARWHTRAGSLDHCHVAPVVTMTIRPIKIFPGSGDTATAVSGVCRNDKWFENRICRVWNRFFI